MKKFIINLIAWYKKNHSIITTIFAGLATAAVGILALFGIDV